MYAHFAAALLFCLTLPVRAGNAWTDPDNPVRTLFRGARLDLWSLQPVRDPAVPALQRSDWARQPVDAFILARLEQEGLTPAPEADRRTLARRLAYVLTGLPPEPEMLEAFCADPEPDAFERLTDKLLDSPGFGIHWGRMWLDTVRYSDSNGYDWDEFRPAAWRYRDYVVRAFQEDKPFDRFIREQLAGDELVSRPPEDAAARDALIATGFLRMGPQDNSAKLFGEEHRARAAMEADMAETTATAFLGMTLRCCRCHDHKTDPLSQEDHYRLRAFFAGVKLTDDLVIDTADVHAAIAASQAEAEQTVKSAEARKKEILIAARDRLTAAGKEEMKINAPAVRESLTEDEQESIRQAEAERKRAESERREFTTALGATENRDQPLAAHVLAGGEPDQPRGEVMPGVFTVFSPEPATLPHAADGQESRRLALADWIVAPDNPLTARVLVNRIWQQCFGEGIVRTAGDFGYTGSPPSHPALLDWLACRFTADGWSVKRLARQLVTSATWRQAAWLTDPAARERSMTADADNALLWHARPRRLTAEQLRDSLLTAAGQLTGDPSGPPVWPELPPEVLQANPAFLDDNAEKTKGWYPSPPEQLHVRTIRLVQKRSVKVPFLETFDLPDNFESCTGRGESTGAPQSLTLLNHPEVAACCTAMAIRIAASAGDQPEAQIVRAYALLLQRRPAPGEMGVCLSLLRDRSLTELCRVLVNTNEFLTVE